MKSKTLNLTIAALFPAALLSLTSCSSTPPPPETISATAYQPGVPGGAMVHTHKLTANVTDIDAAERKVTLLNSDGSKTTVKCGPEVVNFDQIRVGDQLKVEVTEQLVVFVAAPGEAPYDRSGGAVLLAPVGAKPGGVMAGATQTTATVRAIDRRNHTATLQFEDGTTKTFRARSDVRLSQRKVGEQVVFRATEVMAISVEKP